MNPIQTLAAQLWVERLGSALLDFLWQGVLIAAVYAAARRWTHRPNARYLLACAALTAMAAAPVLTETLLSTTAPAPIVAPALPSAGAPAARSVPAWFPATIEGAVPGSILPWVVAVWLVGAIALLLRLTGGCFFATRLRSTGVRPAPAEWQQILHRLQTRVRISRPVRLLDSALVQAPAVVGWLRPVILMPLSALAALPVDQVEALLAHELAHVRRHDYLVNLLQSVVEALLFYHPAVWWVSGHLRAERELCCDDIAVSVSGDAIAYARALAEMAAAQRARLEPVVAATGGSLPQRIARLIGQPRANTRTLPGPGILAAAALLFVIALAGWSQPPRFEAASVKPSTNPGFQMIRPLPGRLTADASLRLILQNAFSVQTYQVVAAPSWIDTERYEINATAGGNASPAQVLVMLQSLLEDRFQLQIHREQRQLPVYDLVAARGGLKLPAPKENNCVSAAAEASAGWIGGRIPPPGSAPPPATRCGAVRVRLAPSGGRMEGGKVPMSEFTRTLSLVLGRTVIDQTGFTGLFDVTLDFLPDEITEALPPPPPGAPAESANPSILVALQEQLGLRLESAKGPVEVLVIDHIERPSAN